MDCITEFYHRQAGMTVIFNGGSPAVQNMTKNNDSEGDG